MQVPAIISMNNKLMEIRSHLFGVRTGTGTGTGLSASALDNSNIVTLIIQKQRNIVQLVAEASRNSNSANYDNLIRQRQKELDELVESKKMKGKGAAFSDATAPAPAKLKELRRFLLA